jgi:hypothetical protein
VNGISSAVLGLLGGAAFGALLTGYFTIRQKAVARVQKRRVAVYIDMLAWIGTRLPEHVPYSKAIDTDKNVTVPDPAATDPDTKQTDPDTRFFLTLRALGWVLSYIFTGREALKAGTDEVSRIVQKCGANDTTQRYQQVIDLIADVERLAASPTDTPA